MKKQYNIDAVANYIIYRVNSKKDTDYQLNNIKLNYLLCLIDGLSLTKNKYTLIKDSQYLVGGYSPLSAIYQDLNREYGAAPIDRLIYKIDFKKFTETTPIITKSELIDAIDYNFVSEIDVLIELVANRRNHTIFVKIMDIYKAKNFQFDSLTEKQIKQFYQEISQFETELLDYPTPNTTLNKKDMIMIDKELLQKINELSQLANEKNDYSYESLRAHVRYLMNNHYHEFMKAFFATELNFIMGLNETDESIDESVVEEIYERFLNDDEFTILEEIDVQKAFDWVNKKRHAEKQ